VTVSAKKQLARLDSVRNRQLLTSSDQESARGGTSIGESWPIPPAGD